MNQSPIIINQKPNGQHYRITVQHRPIELSPLVELQEQLSSQLTNFTTKDQEYIHLTLLHLGIPQDLYYEVRKQLPDISLAQFMDKFKVLLLQLHQYCLTGNNAVAVQGSKIEYYGSIKSPAVALSVERNAQLDHHHQQVFTILVQWLQELPISNPMDFIRASRNLRHSPPEVFNPHITLGRVTTKSTQLQPLPSPLTLTIGQPYLAHVTVI